MIKKILIIIPSVLIILIASILIFAPSYASKYINENSKELINRKIYVEDFKLNLFSGKTSITNFKMYEDNDSTIFVEFDTLYIDIDLSRLLNNEVYVEEIKLCNPYVSLLIEDGNFNFYSLIHTDSTTVENIEEHKDTTSIPLTFSLNNINIILGEFLYSDNDSKIGHSIEDLNLHLKHVAFDNTTAEMGLGFRLGDSGLIKTNIAYDTEYNSYTLDVDIDNLNLNEFLPYLKKDINIKDMEGIMYTSLKINGDINNPGEPIIKGTMGVKGFKLTDNKDLEFFNFTELRIKSDELNLKDMNFVVDTLMIDDVNAHLELYNNSSSIDRLFKKNTKNVVKQKAEQVVEIADSLKEGKNVNWEVKHLVLKNSKASFVDYSLKPDKFPYTISNINLTADDIKFGNNVEFIFKSNTPRGGNINANITTDPGKPGNGTFNLYTKNVDTRGLSPFFVNYFAYPITRGKFDFSFRSKINDNNLDSRVIIDMYYFKLGSKRRGVEAQSGLPIKTALIIAADKNKRIHFDVKAKGDIDDPDFNVGKIVFNTIMKNLSKIIVSPGRILSKSLGINEDQIKNVELENAQSNLGPSQLTQLDLISQVLIDKNPLRAKVQLHVNKKDEILELSIRLAKTKYFLKEKYNNDEAFYNFSDNDNLAIDDIKTKNKKFSNYLKTKVNSNNLSNKEMCVALFTAEEINDLYLQLNNKRLSNIDEYLSSKENILFKVESDVIIDNSGDKPYVHFKYFVEREK